MANINKTPKIVQSFTNMWKTAFIGKGADPSSIITKDLNDVNGKTNFTKLNQVNLPNLSPESKKIFGQLMAIYDSHIESKRELLTQARALFDSDIVQTIIDVIMDDAFNSFIDEENEFRIEYRLDDEQLERLGEEFQETVQAQIDDVVQKFDLKSRIADLIPELLRDGEYALGVTFEPGKGITDVVDDLDVIDLLPFYTGEKLSFIIKESQIKDAKGNAKITHNNAPVIYNPDNIIYFRLKYFAKERLELEPDFKEKPKTNFRAKFYQETGIYLPRFVRICRPIYYAAMKNIGQLQIIENINTVQELSHVIRPEIVNVTVPTNTSPIEAKNIVRDYERRLNDMAGQTDIKDLDVSTLASLSYRRVVFPQWMDTKGTLAGSDLNSMNKTEGTRDSITFLRNLIAVSIGIPPFYINITDSPIEKAQMAKMYSRYTRKLTSLQKTLIDGIKDFIMLHLRNKDIYVEEKNIQVTFKTLTNADSLDDTDMMVATITAMNDLYKGLDEIASSPNNNLRINSDQYKLVFDTYTNKYMNISDLLEYDPTKEQEGEFDSEMTDMPGGDFEPSSDIDFDSGNISSDNDLDFEVPEEPEGPSNNNSYQDFANSSANNIQSTGGPQNVETEV